MYRVFACHGSIFGQSTFSHNNFLSSWHATASPRLQIAFGWNCLILFYLCVYYSHWYELLGSIQYRALHVVCMATCTIILVYGYISTLLSCNISFIVRSKDHVPILYFAESLWTSDKMDWFFFLGLVFSNILLCWAGLKNNFNYIALAKKEGENEFKFFGELENSKDQAFFLGMNINTIIFQEAIAS